MTAPAAGYDVARTFLRWTFSRAVCHKGYVLVSGLYYVITAHLSAFELLVLGTVLSATLLLSDIPTGVWSDAVSRKWPLVITSQAPDAPPTTKAACQPQPAPHECTSGRPPARPEVHS